MRNDAFANAASKEAFRVWFVEPTTIDTISELGIHMAEWARDYIAAEESTELDDMAHRLSSLLGQCTGSLLTKTNYTVETMVTAIENHYREQIRIEQAEDEEDTTDEEAGAVALVLYLTQAPYHTKESWEREPAPIHIHYRQTAHAALVAARAVRQEKR